MRDHSLRGSLLAMALPLAASITLVALASGCVGTSRVQAHRTGESDVKVARLLVVVKPGPWDVVFEEAFKSRFPAALRGRGVDARVLDLTGRSGSDAAAAAMLEAANAFQAQGVLMMGAVDVAVRDYGRVSNAKLVAKLFDVVAGRVVWQADIAWTPGGHPAVRADELGGQLLAALAADGLLAGEGTAAK